MMAQTIELDALKDSITLGPLAPGLYVIECEDISADQMESVTAFLGQFKPEYRFLVLGNGARLARNTPPDVTWTAA